MSYTINPKIQYKYGCDSLVVYNDIYSNMSNEESGSLTALSFRLRRYNESEYQVSPINVTNPSTATTWGTISTSDLISYRYYPTTDLPGSLTTYEITITYTDGTIINHGFTSSSSTWKEVFEGIAADIAIGGYAISNYDSTLNSLFISDGSKIISSIVIVSDNSDTGIEDPSIISGDSFISDVYAVEVDYTVDAVPLTRTYYLPVYCEEYKCILNLVGDIPDLVSCDSCNDDCIDYIITVNNLMTALKVKELNNDPDITDAQEIISSLSDICNNKDCQCYG